MKHSDFFSCAVQISGKLNPTEVEIRNSISRVYYFIYHEALRWIDNNEHLTTLYNRSGGTSHQKVSAVFQSYARDSRVQTYIDIAKRLKALHQYRCDADYELKIKVSIRDLNIILTQLKSLRDLTLRTKNPYFDVQAETFLVEENQHKAQLTPEERRSRLRALD